MAAPMPATTRPPRLPMDVAFLEAAAHVRNSLDALGIRWSDQAEQAAVCTILIQAGKSGWLLPWNPPQKSRQDDRSEAGRLPDVLPDPPAPRTRLSQPQPINTPKRPASEGAAVTVAASTSKSFPVMIRAFHEIAQELPPEVFTAVLMWYGVEKPKISGRNRPRKPPPATLP